MGSQCKVDSKIKQHAKRNLLRSLRHRLGRPSVCRHCCQTRRRPSYWRLQVPLNNYWTLIYLDTPLYRHYDKIIIFFQKYFVAITSCLSDKKSTSQCAAQNEGPPSILVHSNIFEKRPKKKLNFLGGRCDVFISDILYN